MSNEVIITVYRNGRHLRANRPELNDMSRTYISQKAIRALLKIGVKFKFIRSVTTFTDCTEEYLAKITEAKYAYETQVPKETKTRKVSDDFDPFDRKRA